MRMDIPFILHVCQNVIVYVYHISVVVCISVSNMADPQILLQNRTLISKQDPYPKGISRLIPYSTASLEPLNSVKVDATILKIKVPSKKDLLHDVKK